MTSLNILLRITRSTQFLQNYRLRLHLKTGWERMAGLAEPIKLREFTDHNPQIRIEDVHPGMYVTEIE